MESPKQIHFFKHSNQGWQNYAEIKSHDREKKCNQCTINLVIVNCVGFGLEPVHESSGFRCTVSTSMLPDALTL
ncbi:hypothetical protein QVD17_36557 [Tagetes erecta]|uniref:Uncharacterized protein n=1 Tax=Tagetes erecta TaxID=13708 RepID=A0AAD8NBZ4_TARER|nr:hypothetical protein QVD17_36557 [Tagetes erecta]